MILAWAVTATITAVLVTIVAALAVDATRAARQHADELTVDLAAAQTTCAALLDQLAMALDQRDEALVWRAVERDLGITTTYLTPED